MANYLVRWEIDIDDVDSPREAAERAWEAMRRPDSIANVFGVTDADGIVTTVDLEEDEEWTTE